MHVLIYEPHCAMVIILVSLQGTWVVAAFRQLHRCAKGFFRSGYGHKDQVSGLKVGDGVEGRGERQRSGREGARGRKEGRRRRGKFERGRVYI